MSAVRAGEGDTGATRSGGAAAGDAFTKREHSEELRYVKDQERQKLMALKKKLADQRKHLDDLDKHIDDLTKEQGGEQN